MKKTILEVVGGILCTVIAGCGGQPGISDQSGPVDDRKLPRHYLCRKTSGTINVDGRLDEPAWSKAPWTVPFADIEGFAKPKPRFQTRAKMLWDDQYLYIGAQLEEPHVWGTLKQHDEIVFNDNDFEIFIDPNGDQRNYYEFETNALGTIFDLFLVRTYIDGGPALHGWDCRGLKNAVFVDGTINNPSDTDRGWSVEFAIPWTSLKEAAGCTVPPNEGDTWRMNFSRVEWQIRVVDGQYEKIPNTPENNWIWSPQGVIDMHRPERWAYARFTLAME